MRKLTYIEHSYEHFMQWPASLRHSLVFLLSILCLALNYGFITRSNMNRYEQEYKEELHLKAKFEKQQPFVNLQAYQKQLKDIELTHAKQLTHLVKENEVSSLLNEMTQTGVNLGLVFELFAPTIKGKNNLIINIKVLGEYQELALFLSNLSNFSQLVTFDHFKIVKDKRTDDNLLCMTFTAKIYRYYNENL